MENICYTPRLLTKPDVSDGIFPSVIKKTEVYDACYIVLKIKQNVVARDQTNDLFNFPLGYSETEG